MLYNIKPILLHRVFHGIRFKVNKDWVSGIDTLLFYIPPVKKKNQRLLLFLPSNCTTFVA